LAGSKEDDSNEIAAHWPRRKKKAALWVAVPTAVLAVAAAANEGVKFVLEAEAAQTQVVGELRECQVVDMNVFGTLIVEIDSKREYVSGGDTIKWSYAYNPGPLKCGRRADGKLHFEPRPFKPAP